MGHTSISTTQIYAQVTDTKVDEDMKRLRSTGFGNRIDLCEEDFTVRKKRKIKSPAAMKWKTEKLPACPAGRVSPCLIKEAVLYPALFLPAPFVGIVQYFHDIGLFIECLSLAPDSKGLHRMYGIPAMYACLPRRTLESSSSVRKRSPLKSDLGTSSITESILSIFSSPWNITSMRGSFLSINDSS